MSKQGLIIFNGNTLVKAVNFKKCFLMFDKIIIEKWSYGIAKNFIEFLVKKDGRQFPGFDSNIQDIEYLNSQGLLEFRKMNYVVSEMANSCPIFSEDEYLLLFEVLNESKKFIEPFKSRGLDVRDPSLSEHWVDHLNKAPNPLARMLSLAYNKIGIETFPIYQTTPVYSIGKKEQVLKFLLHEIPEPAENIAWEQVMDFKLDPDTKKKYTSLICWMNSAAKKDTPIYELKDEFDSLYHEYVGQYNIHRMKYKTGTIEIVITAAIDVLSGNLGVSGLSTSLISIFRQHLNLLESESKTTGREVAYIHKTKEAFQ